MTASAALLASIEAYLAESGMAHSRFSMLAAGAYSTVSRLRAGLGVHTRTVDRITQFMADNPPEQMRRERQRAEAQKPVLNQRQDRTEWFALREMFVAEARRLWLPPQTTLAGILGVSRERGRQLLTMDAAGTKAIAPVRRWLEMARHVKPKPDVREAKKAAKAAKRAELEAVRAARGDLIRTVAEMTTAHGSRTKAAREMGISPQHLNHHLSGYCIGPKTYAAMSAWVERNQS